MYTTASVIKGGERLQQQRENEKEMSSDVSVSREETVPEEFCERQQRDNQTDLCKQDWQERIRESGERGPG